jgi:uncharacterized membrane protein YdcZ (DUF606 family)
VAQNQPNLRYRIDALLAEYEACYKTRDHYDSINWTIGSIFIASVLLLLGQSFQIKIQTFTDRVSVLLIALVSFLLVVIWFVYIQHVQPTINRSIERAREIENWLYFYGITPSNDVTLQRRMNPKGGTGKAITTCLFALMLTAVIVRVILALL